MHRINIHSKCLHAKEEYEENDLDLKSKKTNITLMPLGPVRPDNMDPSAAMRDPGSPRSPCMDTHT